MRSYNVRLRWCALVAPPDDYEGHFDLIPGPASEEVFTGVRSKGRDGPERNARAVLFAKRMTMRRHPEAKRFVVQECARAALTQGPDTK